MQRMHSGICVYRPISIQYLECMCAYNVHMAGAALRALMRHTCTQLQT